MPNPPRDYAEALNQLIDEKLDAVTAWESELKHYPLTPGPAGYVINGKSYCPIEMIEEYQRRRKEWDDLLNIKNQIEMAIMASDIARSLS